MKRWRFSRRWALSLLVGLLLARGTPVSSQEVTAPYKATLVLGTLADDRMESPRGIAIDPQGNITIADGGLARVQRRIPQGQLLRQWGSFSTPSGTERLMFPTGIAISGTGSIYVADTQRKRVRIFSPDGQYLDSVGAPGTGDGAFLSPVGVALDGAGNLYVADEEANQIQKFGPQGAFSKRWGTRGVGNGQLRSPRGIAIDKSGNVYVTDTENHRVQKFDSQGQFLLQWGGLGFSDGLFNQPVGIATDRDSNVLVVDTGNSRVQMFDAQGVWLSSWAAAGAWIATDAGGSVFVSNPGGGRVTKFSAQGQLLTSWGRPGTREGELRSPRGVAVGALGAIVAADTGNHRVQVFDSQGKAITSWGARGISDGQFDSPVAVATDPDGNVYVLDAGNNRIQKFDAVGKFLTKWGKAGANDGEFQSPKDITVRGSVVYVLDAGNYRVQKFDTSGRFLEKWGSQGTASGQFVNPTGLAVDRAGNAYVADYALADAPTNSVQRFTPQGNLLRRWDAADLVGINPYSVAIDDLGNLYLTDLPRVSSVFPQSGHDRIVRLDLSGQIAAQVGGTGNDVAQLSAPMALAVDQQQNILVADTLNQRIQKFSAVAPATPTPAAGPAPIATSVPKDAPTLLSPPSATTLGSLGATVMWQNPPSTAQYHLQVTPYNSDGPGIDVIVGDTIQISTASYTIPAPVLGQGPYIILPDMTYSWRVRTSASTVSLSPDSPEWRPWSETWTFRTPARTAMGIVPVTPHDGQKITADRTAITWRYPKSDVFYFELQVSKDPTFETNPIKASASVWWVLLHGGVSDPFNTWYTPPLERNTLYYWRVRPRVQGDGVPVTWPLPFVFKTP